MNHTLLVEGTFDLPVKRLYLPIVETVYCPHCGACNAHDFNDNYLMYPSVNQKTKVYYCCEECDEEFYFYVTLHLSLDVSCTTIKA